MPAKTALIAGATGLIGQQLLDLLLNSAEYDQVIALTREGSEFSLNNDKLNQVVVDFDALENHSKELQADHIFCCLGTTMRKAGSEEKFRKVDFEYPFKLAHITKANGSSQYHLVSSLGANKNARVFYNRVKGEVEEAIKSVGFDVFHIYRPSLLMGERYESRSGEDAAKVFFNLFGFLFRGPLKKYRAIDSQKVAKAMLLYAFSKDQSGMVIHESQELQDF